MTPAELQVQIKGEEERIKLQNQQANVHAWLTGAYVRLAVASVLDSSVDYPEEPFGLRQEKQAEDWEISKMKMAGFAVKVEQKLSEERKAI